MSTSIDKAIQYGFWFSPSETFQAYHGDNLKQLDSLHPQPRIHAPGGNRLDVVLHETPNKAEFGTQKVDLPVKSGGKFIENIKITHPWNYQQKYQVCAGLVAIITDRGEVTEAISLGGNLSIEPREGYTICTLESPAPILVITGAKPIEKLFVDEIEILLAGRKAAWLDDPNAYDQRLINADPMELYTAILNSMIEKFEHSHHKDNLQISELLNFLHDERQRLREEELVPLNVARLDTIL